jgi:hypothetical protein
VINQGVSMTVHGPLPCDTALTLSVSIESMEPAAGRVRVVVAIFTGVPGQARLVETRLHMSFLLPGKRPPKTAAPRPPARSGLAYRRPVADRRQRRPALRAADRRFQSHSLVRSGGAALCLWRQGAARLRQPGAQY